MQRWKWSDFKKTWAMICMFIVGFGAGIFIAWDATDVFGVTVGWIYSAIFVGLTVYVQGHESACLRFEEAVAVALGESFLREYKNEAKRIEILRRQQRVLHAVSQDALLDASVRMHARLAYEPLRQKLCEFIIDHRDAYRKMFQHEDLSAFPRSRFPEEMDALPLNYPFPV